MSIFSILPEKDICLFSAEFMQIVDKNMTENVHEKGKIVHILKPILPQNEWQIRPLLEKLEHHGQRIKVWAQVAFGKFRPE